MAEAIALAASVITIVALVKESISKYRCFTRASEELESLRGELEDFAVLIDEIKDQHSASATQAVRTALHRASLNLQQLHSTIQNKVWRAPNTTGRGLQRVWAKHRKGILKFEGVLRENKLGLLAAISSNSLSSSNRSELMVSQQDQRLQDIQKTVLATNHAVQSRSLAMQQRLQLLSSGPGGYSKLNVPQPASPLELSRNFLPETYTTIDRFPRSYLILIRSY
ncbi:MAG: hypothetical protein Q9180_008494 [Flavoplaca navasiana]